MGTPDPRSIRIGNVEREQAVQALGDHFAQGRLDPHEFEERTTAAYTARTAADLDVLFDDLPRPGNHPAVQRAEAPTVPRPGVPVPRPDGPFPVLHDPHAPYGREPVTGLPYSDRSKTVAGVLQLLLPFGVGRLYSGHAGIGIAQLLLSVFFVGVLWSFIDGIIILVGRPTDPYGRPLRP